MNCPNCEKLMEDKSYRYFGLADWDEETTTLHEEFWCSTCLIRYENGKWEIPENIVATKKQVNCINIINNKLGTYFEPLIKSKCIEFIHNNMNKSFFIKHKYDCENDNDDIFYENDLWCEHY